MKEIHINGGSKIEVSLLDGSVEEGNVVGFFEEGIFMHDCKESWLVKFEDIKKVVRIV